MQCIWQAFISLTPLSFLYVAYTSAHPPPALCLWLPPHLLLSSYWFKLHVLVWPSSLAKSSWRRNVAALSPAEPTEACGLSSVIYFERETDGKAAKLPWGQRIRNWICLSFAQTDAEGKKCVFAVSECNDCDDRWGWITYWITEQLNFLSSHVLNVLYQQRYVCWYKQSHSQ